LPRPNTTITVASSALVIIGATVQYHTEGSKNRLALCRSGCVPTRVPREKKNLITRPFPNNTEAEEGPHRPSQDRLPPAHRLFRGRKELIDSVTKKAKTIAPEETEDRPTQQRIGLV